MSPITLAILTDLHGNLPALRAIEDDIRSHPCHEILHLGDAIALGPHPRETLEGLIALQATLLMGNHEEYYLAQGASLPAYTHPGEWAHQIWTSAAVGVEHLPRIRSLPYRIERVFHTLRFVFLHYPLDNPLPPRSFKSITPLCTPEEADAFFDEAADAVFFGHHHAKTDLFSPYTNTRYVNPGPCGCSKDALARYVRLTVSEGGFTVEHRALPYDKASMVLAMGANKVPQGSFLLKFFHGVEDPSL